MSVVDAIVAANFAATEPQVEALATSVVDGTRADGTYLRVVIAHVQAQIGAPKRRRAATDTSQLEALEAIHTRLYAAVLRGVGGEDVTADERRRRATFARSATSTVRRYVKSGGDIRALDVKDVSKGKLRRAVGPPIGERVEQEFNRARRALERAASRLCRQRPKQAAQLLDDTLNALEQIAETITPPATDTTVITPHLTPDMRQPGAQLHAPS